MTRILIVKGKDIVKQIKSKNGVELIVETDKGRKIHKRYDAVEYDRIVVVDLSSSDREIKIKTTEDLPK